LTDWLLVHQLGRGWRIKIVLPCQGQLEHFQGILTEPAAAQLLPCLIDSQRWSLIQQVAAQRSDSKKLKIGYLGRLSRLKNILPMIDLFAPLIARGECELHLAGPFDDFDKNDITKGVGFYMKDVLERLEGQPGVYYHKVKQTDEEVYSFLAGLDGFCTLSTQGGEDFCFAVAEALAMGLPCLVNAWMALNDHAQRSSFVTLLENRTNPDGEVD